MGTSVRAEPVVVSFQLRVTGWVRNRGPGTASQPLPTIPHPSLPRSQKQQFLQSFCNNVAFFIALDASLALFISKLFISYLEYPWAAQAQLFPQILDWTVLENLMSSIQTPWFRLFQSHPGGQFASEELWEVEKQRMRAEILLYLGAGECWFSTAVWSIQGKYFCIWWFFYTLKCCATGMCSIRSKKVCQPHTCICN